VAKALSSADAFHRLTAIGRSKWAERTATLERLIEADPKMRELHWSSEKAAFV
jgi:hypothetical protein